MSGSVRVVRTVPGSSGHLRRQEAWESGGCESQLIQAIRHAQSRGRREASEVREGVHIGSIPHARRGRSHRDRAEWLRVHPEVRPLARLVAPPDPTARDSL